MAAIPDHEQGVDAILVCFYVFQPKLTDELIQVCVGAIPLKTYILVLYAQAVKDLFDSFCVLNYLFEILMLCFVVYFVEDPQPDEPHGNKLWKRHVVRSFRC